MARTGPVLITGGTGFVGGHLRSALAGEPEENSVVLLGRRRPEDLRPGERHVPLDLNGPVGPEKLAGGETLCHLAYSMSDGRGNVASNERLLAAVNAAANVRHVVLLSSTSVYGASRSPVVDEESPCEPVGEYAETKLACEEVWRRRLREDCTLTRALPSLQGLVDAEHERTVQAKRPDRQS